MKQPAKTAGIRTKTPAANEYQIHPTVRWWPIQTPRLLGEPFTNPVTEIPTAKTPITPQPSEG